MDKISLALGLICFASQAVSDGCGGLSNNYKGIWLDSSGTPTANYTLSIDAFAVGAVGCYWIEATPGWGIDQDTQEVVKITNTNLDGGVLFAVGRSLDSIDSGQNAWVWVRQDGLTSSTFSEMYFNRQTRGLPR